MIRRWALVALLVASCTAPAAWLVPSAPHVVQRYEDGSYVLSDGSTACTPGALCDDGEG